MASSRKALTPLQRAFLERFFGSVKGFYLTGGGALGIHFAHRRSLDLDLFTREEVAFRAARASLPAIASDLGAKAQIVADSPAFLRYLITRPGGESLRVDIVHDRAERVGPEPREEGGAILDPPEEILANKICAMLGRSELRDLLDLYVLDRAGFRVLDGLEAARRKDGGLTPAALAWAISQVRLESPPEGMLEAIPVEDLRAFAERLRRELRARAFPREEG